MIIFDRDVRLQVSNYGGISIHIPSPNGKTLGYTIWNRGEGTWSATATGNLFIQADGTWLKDNDAASYPSLFDVLWACKQNPPCEAGKERER